jgi:hypothetical protein
MNERRIVSAWRRLNNFRNRADRRRQRGFFLPQSWQWQRRLRPKMKEVERLRLGRSLGSANLELVIMMRRRWFQFDVGVERQCQVIVPSLIRAMVMPGMQMGKWGASERKDNGNYQAMDSDSAH